MANAGLSTFSAAASRDHASEAASFLAEPIGKSSAPTASPICARYTLETDEGELILVRSDGLRHGPPDVIARLARGESVEPSHYYFRTILRFEASSQKLAWLNRILTVARGRRDVDAVRLDVFEVL
jgi:Protein of unknown function (DUF3237)